MESTTATRPFTRSDLVRFPDDGNRYELLDGSVLVTPAPRPRHQQALVHLAVLFHGLDVIVLPAPVDVVFGIDTVLQPDLCVWRVPFDVERVDTVPIPDLVVEVSSASTRRRDLTMKRPRYAAEGIAEFWFVDLDNRRILVHRLVDGSYVVADDDPATSHLFDLTVTFDDLLPAADG